MQPMYPGIANSPVSELADAIDATATTIEVVDGSKLPNAPNLATIGTGEDAETILYEQKTGNILSDVTRGFQGTAKAWPAGTKVSRMFTEYDHASFRQNIQELNTTLSDHTGNPVIHPRVFQQDTPPDNPQDGDLWINTSDDAYQGTVFAQLQQEIAAHKADDTIHKTSDVIRAETETKLKVEVVSSSESETPEAGRIIFDTSQGKFFGGTGSGWV